jgi:hypothetical protein
MLFILWIVSNGIGEGFRGTAPEIVSFVGLLLLLTLNSTLLWIGAPSRPSART